ncbi:MAG: FtsQ-type POTRA domain-containing protein [bacterium]|nr:FtsQ-type POTRA domain-containing protein [bacterium]
MAYYPYVAKRRHPLRYKQLFKKMFFWFFISSSIIGGGAYYFFFSNIFSIDRIEVRGIENHADIREVVLGYLSEKTAWGLTINNNYFFVSPADLQALVENRFPALASVAIAKAFPHIVRLNVKEREYAATWCSTGSMSCYLMDIQGVLYRDAASSSGTLVFILKSSLPLKLGDTVMDGSSLASLAMLRNTLRDRFALAVKDFFLDNMPDVTANMVGDWRLMFNISKPSLEVLDALQKTLAAIGTDKKIEYIDLRIDNRVYYKTTILTSPQ